MRQVLITQLHRLHALTRRSVGLAATPPDPSSLVFTPTGDGLNALTIKTPEQTAADTDAWHAAPRHARMIDGAFAAAERVIDLDVVDGARRQLRRARYAHRQRQALNAMLDAEQLHWRPYHWAAAGDCQHVDGRLFAGTRQLTLDISCAGDSLYWAREAVTLGGVLEEGPDRRVRQIVLPTQMLGRGLIETALKLWYMDHASLRQGHWTVRRRALPTITVESPWEDDSPDTPQAADAERAAIAAFNAELIAAAADARCVHAWALHGVTLEDLLVPEPSC